MDVSERDPLDADVEAWADYWLMLVLDAEALSAVAHGPAARRDRVRALIAQTRAKELPVATVAAVAIVAAEGAPFQVRSELPWLAAFPD